MHDNAVYWVWLNELRGLPLQAKRKLLQTLGSPKELYQSSLECVTQVLSNSSRYASTVAEGPKERAYVSAWAERNLEYAESVLRNNENHGIHLLCPLDEHYRRIYANDQKNPLLLYYRGTLSHPDIPIVGVIGSRSCTSYGKMVTGAAVSELVQKGNIIASGLSFGIDALAHEATLQCKGVTYAFVPCGLHTVQPASHAALMEQIADTGAVISPYVFGKEALPFRFIGRNNLLAAWCDTLLVIEAGSTSGTMNTARSALKKGKRVLAVPNSLLEPRSCGTNHLLVEGAQAYVNDRLLLLDHKDQNTTLDSLSQQSEQAIIKALRTGSLSTSEMATLVQDKDLSVMECLSDMELADKIVFRSDGKWHLVGGL